ncbi:MAG: hypothetical protein KME25_31735 [Symplocastrum torsivum CPER-KK1]|uniref:Uncharacterized protein n=1 Tax=Symplocastrum torsivum CPER-KK1 TaxID=450513 RepID=A0A951UD53_9CYAN|nr:hypothetical protein [Symplocastrum torsivum CPER-KK1]
MATPLPQGQDALTFINVEVDAIAQTLHKAWRLEIAATKTKSACAD